MASLSFMNWCQLIRMNVLLPKVFCMLFEAAGFTLTRVSSAKIGKKRSSDTLAIAFTHPNDLINLIKIQLHLTAGSKVFVKELKASSMKSKTLEEMSNDCWLKQL